MATEGFGDGPVPAPKKATNEAQSRTDEERGYELLLAVLLGMGIDASLLPHLPIEMRMKILDAIVMETSASLVSATRDLMNKKITPNVWFLRMRDILIAASAAGALALLGKREMDDDEREAWASEIDGQYGYLVKFRNGIKDGSRVLGPVSVAAADLYARTIWSTSWRVMAASVIAANDGADMDTEAFRILSDLDHCRDCIDWGDLGWVRVDSKDYHPIGTSVCGGRCGCHYEYRAVPRRA